MEKEGTGVRISLLTGIKVKLGLSGSFKINVIFQPHRIEKLQP